MIITPPNSTGGYQGETQRVIGAVGPENYRPVIVRADILVTAIALTDVIDVSEVGKLIAVAIRCTTVFAGSPRAHLEVVIDGETQQDYAVSDASTNRWGTDMVGFKRGDFAIVTDLHGVVVIPFNLRYSQTLRVGLDVTTGGSAGRVMVTTHRGVRI